MAGPDKPRALVLSEDDRAIVIRRLAKALLRFQDSFLDREGSPAGLLCQVWLPEVTSEGEVTLRTKGMPFCVAGLGDLLALFRCISCRFAFGTDVKKAAQLGAPGRVFTSSEPELTCNVQKYSKTAYLRKAEAEQCHVQSTLLLPVFLSAARHGCVGVLEVVQTSEDMHFTEVADLIASVMEKCDLYTSTRASIERQLPRAVAAAAGQVMLPPSVDVLRPVHTAGSEDSGERANSTDGAPMADEAILEQATMGGSGGLMRGQVGSQDQAQLRQAGALAAAARAAASRGGGGGAHQAQVSGDEDDEDMGEDSEGEDEADGFGGSAGGAGRAGHTKSAGTVGTRRRGKGTGNPGKPGVRLRLEDLQSQFGVGLKEAAARLGICPTTLKRACRRHGIQRWPRRQLAKVNQVLDQMDVQGGAALLQQQQQATLLQQQQAQQLGALGGGLPAPDTRWTALAQFIPQLRQTVNYGDTLLAGFGGGQQHLQGMGPLPQIGNGPSNGAALDMLNWGAGSGSGGAGAGAGPLGPSFGGPMGGVPQFVELPNGGANGLPQQPQQQQQQAQQPVKADGLPPGVLPAPPQLWGMTTNAPDGPALSGLSSLGQPPPAAGSDAGAAAVQRLSALKAISAARGGSGAGGGSGGPAGLSGGTPLPIGALNNLGGLSSRSWGMPGTPHLLSTSLDFDLTALAQQTKAAAGQGGAAPANGHGGEARDDDVGFIDPTVLEMLLQEDANRGGVPMPLEQANHTLGISGVLNSLKFG